MNPRENRLKRQPSKSPRFVDSQSEQSTQMHSPHRRGHHHLHHHHQQQQQQQHVHHGGRHHHHQVAIHVIAKPKSSSRRKSRRPKSSSRRRRSASASRASSVAGKEQTRSASSQTADEDSDVQRAIEQRQCRLCSKVREMHEKSGHLTRQTEGSDVVVRASDGKRFYCHSFVVDVWAPNLLRGNKSADNGFEIVVDDFPSDVVGACLCLMYGGTVEGMPLELLTEMMRLASTYQIPELESACSQAASTAEFTPANVCHLWYYAIVQNLDQLQQRAARFVLDNVKAIVKDPLGQRAWDEVVKKPRMLLDLFYAISESTRSKPEIIPPRDTQMDELWNQSDGLRKPHGYPDLTIVTKEETTFYVHLPLITLSAPAFANMLHQQRRNNDRVRIGDFDGDVVEEFLRGLYHQEPGPSFPELVDHVYVMACDYDAESVADAYEREMAEVQLNSKESAIQLLQEAEEHRMPVAKSMCFRYLYEAGNELRGDEEWTKLVCDYPLLIAEMIVDWESYRRRATN